MKAATNMKVATSTKDLDDSAGYPMSQLKREAFFPTLIFNRKMSDAEDLNKQLLNSIYALREKDNDGLERSHYKGLGGWHSHNNLHKTEAFAEIKNRFLSTAKEIEKMMGYDPRKSLKIHTMWSIINPPGSANKSHIHPGSDWSGVYYVHAPEKAGQISFQDPRAAQLMSLPSYKPNQKRVKEAWTSVQYQPTPGRLLIFPSWLYHSVAPNMSELEGDAANRVIISLNLSQR